MKEIGVNIHGWETNDNFGFYEYMYVIVLLYGQSFRQGLFIFHF